MITYTVQGVALTEDLRPDDIDPHIFWNEAGGCDRPNDLVNMTCPSVEMRLPVRWRPYDLGGSVSVVI